MQSSCRMKSEYSFSVCKSPGPFLTLIQPSGVTLKTDLYRGPGNTFQPVRSLPLKMGVSPYGRTFTDRISSRAPGATATVSGVGAREGDGPENLPEMAKGARPDMRFCPAPKSTRQYCSPGFPSNVESITRSHGPNS